MTDRERPPLAASYARRRALLGASLVLAALAVWGIHHVATLAGVVHGTGTRLAVLYAALFVLLVWQQVFAYFERPFTCTPDQQSAVDTLRVVGVIPLYNEDPAIVRQSIESFVRQSRTLYGISVCDDGSDQVDYAETRAWFYALCREHRLRGIWTRQSNAGKRHAQVTAWKLFPEADVFALVDSDSVLDRDATAEGVKPFADPQVMSVAAMVAAANTRHNLFTRAMDLWYVALQFTDRSVMSVFRSVLVNYGALAYYRATVLRKHEDGYLNETFMGRPMKISDDSLLTLYCLMEGKTVQQISCWAFTYMPTTFAHHRKQQLRWMRGSFIRSLWRMRYLPATRFAFWGHLLKWLQFAIATTAWIAVALTVHLMTPTNIAIMVGIQCAIYYGVFLRYLSFRRDDQSLAYQLGTWLMTPVAALWAATFLRGCRWWAMATCFNMAWGTRKRVEVKGTRRTRHRRDRSQPAPQLLAAAAPARPRRHLWRSFAVMVVSLCSIGAGAALILTNPLIS